MRILSPPRRTTIAGATFSRNSEAIDSLGRIALPGLPRLEYVKGVGWVTWVEEADVNLLTPNQASVETDLTGFNSVNSAALSRDTTIFKYGNASLKTATPGVVANEGFYTSFASVVASNTYTASVWFKGSGTVLLGISEYTAASVYVGLTYTSTITLTDTWTRYSVSRAFGSTGERALIRIITTSGTAQNITFYADGLQLEQKAYPTSFCMPGSPRAAESLTMSTTGLSVTEGTIEGIVEITDVSKRQVSGQYPKIFYLGRSGGSAGIAIHHQDASAYWYLTTTNDNQITTYSSNISDSLTNGLCYYKVRWSVNEAIVEFWELSSRTKVASEIISSPNLPSAFDTKLYIGCLVNSTNFANTRFDRHRLSNIARTDDPDFDNLMPDDANTVGIFDPTPVYNHLIA
jgi:hypothetical protein